MTELQEQMNKDLKECPIWIVNDSISSLKQYFSKEDIAYIQAQYKNDTLLWWTNDYFHFGWGMNIRNHFRNTICLDDQLPTGNFDDYYIQFVELVCELRSL